MFGLHVSLSFVPNSVFLSNINDNLIGINPMKPNEKFIDKFEYTLDQI